MGHHTPESFFSDTPPQRLIGVEVENDIQVKILNENGHRFDRDNYISPEAIKAAGFNCIGHFLNNGAKLHVDNSDKHLEYCSPESLGPDQAAAADLAGVAVLSAIVTASGYEHEGVYRISGTSFGDEQEVNVTSGTHESFLIPRRLTESVPLRQAIAAHLASRVWAMSGTPTMNGFRFSQKVPDIGGSALGLKLEQRATAKGKHMAIIPPYNNEGDIFVDPAWARLENRFADPLLSLSGKRLALGATSLVIRLAEHEEHFTNKEFDDVTILGTAGPVNAAHMFMSDLSMSSTVDVKSGKRMTALDIQEHLALMALSLDQSEKVKLPGVESRLIREWLMTIDALRRSNVQNGEYDRYLLRHFDFAAKHRQLVVSEALASKSKDRARALSLAWDRGLPKGTGLQYWEKVEPGRAEQIEPYIHTPPPTRAAARAKYIDDHHDDPLAGSIDWARYNLRGENTKNNQVFSDQYGDSLAA